MIILFIGRKSEVSWLGFAIRAFVLAPITTEQNGILRFKTQSVFCELGEAKSAPSILLSSRYLITIFTILHGTTIILDGFESPIHFFVLSSARTALIISSFDRFTGSSILNLVFPLKETG